MIDISSGLQAILASETDRILAEPRRLRGFLKDFYPGVELEVNLIILSLGEGVPQSLRQSALVDQLLVDKLVLRLIERVGLSKANSLWAIQCWAKSLGIVLPPVSFSPPSPADLHRPRQVGGSPRFLILTVSLVLVSMIALGAILMRSPKKKLKSQAPLSSPIAQVDELGGNVTDQETPSPVTDIVEMPKEVQIEVRPPKPKRAPVRSEVPPVAVQEQEEEEGEAVDTEMLRQRAVEDLRFAEVRAGVFRMGCTKGDRNCRDLERPSHTVQITRSFRMSSFETTVGAYQACIDANVCSPLEGVQGGAPMPRLPVTGVNWLEAQAFCEWLGGRLPSEAEWEYAARGVLKGSRFPFGNKISHNQANFEGVGEGDLWWAVAAPVGSFPSNGWQLHDLAGNVREWVADWYQNYTKEDRMDPSGPTSGSVRVLRGGGFKSSEEDLRVSARQVAGPTARASDIGFRCVLPS